MERQIRPYIGRFDLIVLGGYVASLALPLLRRLFPEQPILGVDVNSQRIAQCANRSQKVVCLASPVMSETLWLDDLRAVLPDLIFEFPNCLGWEQVINDREVSTELLRADLEKELNLKFDQYYTTTQRGRHKRIALPFIERISIANAQQAGDKTATQHFLQIRQLAQDSPDVQTFAQNLSSLSNFAVAKKPIYAPAQTLPDAVVLLNTHYWVIKPELAEIFGWKVRVMDFREKLLHDVCFALKLRGVHGGRPE